MTLTAATSKMPSSSFYQRAPLRIKKLSEKATVPQAGSLLAAGLDLSSAKDMVIPPGGRALVPTDLSIACPPGTYGRIAPRSGLAYKKGIDVGAGVIDADYRGPLGVILFNWGNEPFEIKVGDRIAQLILEQIVLPDICVVDDLAETERGAGGFGSTGVSETIANSISNIVSVDSNESDESNDKEQALKKQRTKPPVDGVSLDPPDKADTKTRVDPPAGASDASPSSSSSN